MLVYLQMIETEEERSKFEILYTEYKGLMYHIAYDILDNNEDAEDAVHHAFVKVAEHMEKIGEPICAKTKSFLVTITENRALDVCRMKTRHPMVPYNDETIGLQVEYTGSYELSSCFAKLSSRYREILILKHVHGFSNKEIARMLSLSESNAIKLEQRAKSKLLQLCEAEGLI